MLGKDLYKIEVNSELSNERLKSLVFFYGPLVGSGALSLYQYLVLRGSSVGFDELNNLLISLNVSVDTFEKQCGKLNEYKLLRTLKNDNKYIFVFNNPLTIKEFIKNDIFVRDFILRTSGVHYQELIADIYDEDEHSDFEDVSLKLSLTELNKWSMEDETYLKKRNNDKYDFHTLFDVNVFLKDISTNLLPLRLRTYDNLKQIATLADLYNISYDKMRSFIPRVSKTDSDDFDLKYLRYLCMNSKCEYRGIEDGNYAVPCELFLMHLQDGKEVMEYDKKIIFKLSNDYHLNIAVINVILEHSLKACGNRLLENYIYPIASDMHRNNVNSAKEALDRLSKPYNKNINVDTLPTYDTSKNNDLDEEELEKVLEELRSE